MRQRRQEVSVELRKNKKEDQMLKRRNIEINEPTSPLQESNGQQIGTPMTLDDIMSHIMHPHPEMQFNAVQSVRKMLSRERNPPIDTVIEMGLVPTLIKFLEDFDK
jgi:importin subunit alpha-1/8